MPVQDIPEPPYTKIHRNNPVLFPSGYETAVYSLYPSPVHTNAPEPLHSEACVKLRVDSRGYRVLPDNQKMRDTHHNAVSLHEPTL